MSQKEIVDNYIKNNYSEIIKLKEDPSFRWKNIGEKIQKSNKTLKGFNTKYLGDYTRRRFDIFKFNLENNIVTDYTNYKQPFCAEYKENREKGIAELKVEVDRNNLTDKEIYEKYNVNSNEYKISQIWYKDSTQSKYLMSVLFTSIKVKEENIDNSLLIREEFIQNLNKIEPFKYTSVKFNSEDKTKGYLVIPKQDAHWNKFDINGNNSIEDRFKTFTKSLINQVEKATSYNTLEKIVYIIGSDEFNSEFNSMTTKGTPQQNILSYQEAFEKITEFNIETIKLLSYYAKSVEVVLVNGNHDESAGWHLSHVLKTFFKKTDKIQFNCSSENTKILKLGSNLVCINHGDVIKPKDLAARFPVIAKDLWSSCSNYIVLCGDKHHEVAHDYNGIMFYQVPQLSKAKSKWDDKMGFLSSKAELLTFLFEEDELTNILRNQIK